MGVIAATCTTFFRENVPLLRGYVDALFPETLPDFGWSDPAPRLGDVFVHGSLALIAAWPSDFDWLKETLLRYQCYGDPTVAIRTEDPYPFFLSSSVSLQFNGAALEALYPVDGATLTIMRTSPASGQSIPVGRGTVRNGVATIKTVTDANPGEQLSVAIGARNAIPVRTTAQVKPRG